MGRKWERRAKGKDSWGDGIDEGMVDGSGCPQLAPTYRWQEADSAIRVGLSDDLTDFGGVILVLPGCNSE